MNKLTHFKQLEAELIHILREVVAEFENPVMMYSVGKDSSVMLHLAINIVQCYGIPQRLGPVDLVNNKHLDNSIVIENSLEKLKQRLLK